MLTAWLLVLACRDPGCEPGHLCRAIGTGAAGLGGDGLPALETALYLPAAVFETPSGRLGVVDANNNVVRELHDDGTVHVLVGNGEHAAAVVGAAATDSPLDGPSDAVTGPDGLLYVALEHEGRVIRIGADGRVEGIAGDGTLGEGDEALVGPTGLAFDDAGRLHVVDGATGRMFVVAPDDTVRVELADLAAPRGVTWDADAGRLLVAETGAVRSCDPERGRAEVLLEGLDGPELAIARPGGWWVLEGRLGTVWAIDADGDRTAVIGSGFPGITADDPPERATDTRMVLPLGMWVDAVGDVYVADALQQVVLRCAGCAG